MGVDNKLNAEAAARFVLGLNQGFTKEDVKRAYRRLALVFHPDKNAGQNEEEATKRFQAIAKAKDLLLGLADRSGGSAASAARDLNARRSAAEPKPGPAWTAVWVCGACQMRDLGSSPGTNARIPTACARATASTACFCGHPFDAHEETEPSKGIPKLRCTRSGCACQEFSYVPSGAVCTCGHGPAAHDARPFHGCQATGCTCQTFHHAGMCACRHSWACHRTEIRKATGTASRGKHKKTFCPWWRRSCEQEASPSSAASDSSTSIPVSEPTPAKKRPRPASADVHGRSRPATPTAPSSRSPAPGLSSSIFGTRSSQGFGGARRLEAQTRRPSSRRPSSARSSSDAVASSVPLDVRGQPFGPSPPASRRPPSAPPFARGPTPPATPKARDAEASKPCSFAPPAPAAREPEVARSSATPPATPKAREAEPLKPSPFAFGTPATATPSSTPRSTPRVNEASAGEATVERPTTRPRPSSAPPQRTPEAADSAATRAPVLARGSTIPNRRPPRPGSAGAVRPSRPSPASAAPASEKHPGDGGKEEKAQAQPAKAGSKGSGKAPREEPAAEPDAEPDTEPEAPGTSEAKTARDEASQPGDDASSKGDDWKSKSSRCGSYVGRPCGSASSVATAAAAAAAAAVALDGRPWWERLHDRKMLNKAPRRSGGLPRRPPLDPSGSKASFPETPRTEASDAAEAAPPRRSSLSSLYRPSRPPSARSRDARTRSSSGSVAPSGPPSPRPSTPRPPVSAAKDRPSSPSPAAQYPGTPKFFGEDSDDEGADAARLTKNQSQAMLDRLTELRRALHSSII